MTKRSRTGVWLLLLLPPITMGLAILGYVAWRGITPTDPNADRAIRAGLPLILLVNHLVLFGLLSLLLRRAGEGLRDIGWSLRERHTTLPRELLLGLLLGLGLYLAKELVNDPIRQLIAGQTPTFTSLFRFHPESLEVGLAAAATLLVFIEESIYRGFALPPLQARWGTPAAVAVTSVAFGFLHWGNGPLAILFTGIWGVLFAGIFLWRRNLVAGTAAHALYNLLVLLT